MSRGGTMSSTRQEARGAPERRTPRAARRGEPILLTAVKQGSLETVELLVAVGVDPDARHMGGGFALEYAALEGRLDLVNVLLKSGVAIPNRLIERVEATMLEYAQATGDQSE